MQRTNDEKAYIIKIPRCSLDNKDNFYNFMKLLSQLKGLIMLQNNPLAQYLKERPEFEVYNSLNYNIM